MGRNSANDVVDDADDDEDENEDHSLTKQDRNIEMWISTSKKNNKGFALKSKLIQSEKNECQEY